MLGSLPTDISVTEDVAGNVDLSLIDLTDVDSASGNLTITLRTGSGGTLAATSGGGVSVGGSGTGVLTLTGNQTDLNTFLDAASNIQFTGAADANGNDADTIDFEVTDNGNVGSGGGGTISFGTVNVDISAVNDDPINLGGLPTDITVSEDVTGNVDLSLIDLFDVDSAAGALTVTLSTTAGGNLSATGGGGITVVGSGSGSITLSGDQAALNTYLDGVSNLQYTSAPNAFGNDIDTIQITISDNGNVGVGGGGTILIGSTNVDVIAVNDAPVTVAENYSTNAGAVLSVAASGVLANDSDIEFDPLTAVLTTGPANGTLTLNADGSLTYTPDAGFFGVDSFFYQASDGALLGNPVEVQITVIAGIGTDPDPDPDPDPGPDPVPDPEPEPDPEIDPSEPPDGGTGGVQNLNDDQGDDDGMTAVGIETEPSNIEYSSPMVVSNVVSQSASPDSLFDVFRDRPLAQLVLSKSSLEIELLNRLLQIDLAQSVVWREWDDPESNFGETEIGNFVQSAGTAVGLFSVGYVIWAFRAGALLTALSSSRASWATVDPTALLTSYRGGGKRDEIDEMID